MQWMPRVAVGAAVVNTPPVQFLWKFVMSLIWKALAAATYAIDTVLLAHHIRTTFRSEVDDFVSENGLGAAPGRPGPGSGVGVASTSLDGLPEAAVVSLAVGLLGPGAKGNTLVQTKALLLGLPDATIHPAVAAPAAAAAAAGPTEFPWGSLTANELRALLVGAGESLPQGPVHRAHLIQLIRDAAALNKVDICAIAPDMLKKINVAQLSAHLGMAGNARSRARVLVLLAAHCTRGAPRAAPASPQTAAPVPTAVPPPRTVARQRLR